MLYIMTILIPSRTRSLHNFSATYRTLLFSSTIEKKVRVGSWAGKLFSLTESIDAMSKNFDTTNDPEWFPNPRT